MDIASLGEPDLNFLGLQIWIHGKSVTDARHLEDADWLRVTAHCGAAGASVWASGSILTASAFDRFARECRQLYDSLEGNASLVTDEPNLVARVAAADGYGHFGLTVDITPEHMSQSHRFKFALDQTYLFDVAAQCEDIVERFPNPFASKQRAI